MVAGAATTFFGLWVLWPPVTAMVVTMIAMATATARAAAVNGPDGLGPGRRAAATVTGSGDDPSGLVCADH